jgi:hypothetical protein
MKNYICPIDNRQCHVIDGLFDIHGCEARIAKVVIRKLPCYQCRAAWNHIHKLPLVRFGKHERRILVQAPKSNSDPIIIPPDGVGRSAEEVHRRAMRKLANAGLLIMGNELVNQDTKQNDKYGLKVKRRYNHRTAHLSPLGQAVVEMVVTNLKSWRAIRWDKIQANLISEVCLPLPDLISIFKSRLDQYSQHLQMIRGTGL